MHSPTPVAGLVASRATATHSSYFAYAQFLVNTSSLTHHGISCAASGATAAASIRALQAASDFGIGPSPSKQRRRRAELQGPERNEPVVEPKRQHHRALAFELGRLAHQVDAGGDHRSSI